MPTGDFPQSGGDECTCRNCTGTRPFVQPLPHVEAPPIAPTVWCTPAGELGCPDASKRCATCPLAVPAAPPRAFPLRLMVVGHGRHGKDTVGELLRDDYGATFVSSSLFMAKNVVLPLFPPGHYASVEDCYADRENHRAFWYDAIVAYNKGDLTRLGRAIFAEYDLYVGNRNARELHALRAAGVFDFAIWVDACERVEYREPRSSLTIEPWMCDFVLDNNGTPDETRRYLRDLMGNLLGRAALARQDRVSMSWAGAALADRQA